LSSGSDSSEPVTDCAESDGDLTVYDFQQKPDPSLNPGSTWTILLEVRAPGTSADDTAGVARTSKTIFLIHNAT
jgi:hypothetical protein